MRCLFLAAVCLAHALVTCVVAQEQPAISPSSKAIVLNDSDIKLLLSEHNRLRRLQNSSNIQELTWDNSLVKVAQNWTSRCYYDHASSSSFAGYDEYVLNENLFLTTTWNLQTAINLWYDEIAYYDYATLTCQAGKECGHYTEMVWHSANKLGCALTFCPNSFDPTTNSFRANVYYLMCTFSPPGNWQGELPFKVGPACSKCPASSPWCRDGLCSPVPPTTSCAVQCGCGKINQTTCTCKCNDGWMGSYCEDQCQDTMGSTKCSGYAYLCFNSSYSETIQSQCTKTCGLCVGTTTNTTSKCA